MLLGQLDGAFCRDRVTDMRMMIITFDPPENVGGVEGRAVYYTRELKAMGHFVEVIALAPGYHFTSEEFNGATLHRLPSAVAELGPTFRFVLATISRKSIEFVFLLSGSLSLLGVLVLAYARLTNLHALPFFYGKDLLTASGTPVSLAIASAGVLSPRIAANSKFTASLLPRWMRVRTKILYPAVDPAVTNGIVRRTAGDSKRVLFVGRLVKRKGMDVLLVAFKSLLARLPDCHLEIVGDGPERGRVAATITQLGLAHSVSMRGTLKGSALYQEFANADLFVMPSRATQRDVEGFGTVFLEAGLFGKPVIGTISGGVPEAVEDGITGYLVKEDRPEDLSARMFELLTNEELAENMGRAGRARAAQQFTSAKATSDLISAIDS